MKVYRPNLALLVTLILMTSSLDACVVKRDVKASVQHIESSSGNDVMNMSLHFREVVIMKIRAGRAWAFLHHFPNTHSIQTDLTSLKITTRTGHSVPWIQSKSDSDQIRAVKFTLDGSPDDVILDTEYGATVKSGLSIEEECGKSFHYAVYPIMGDECETRVNVKVSPLTYNQECSLRYLAPAIHANVTPVFTTATGKPDLLQIGLKCYGGSTCTCACSTEMTPFCRRYLTDRKVTSLLPWDESPFAFMIIPFILAVPLKMLCMFVFKRTAIGKYLQIVFDCCLVFSISSLLFFSLIIPVHMDAGIRACSTVFESQGGYFFPLLFWTYFPYVITLLVTTGFIDNADLVVSMNGNLRIVFLLYQLVSPLAQVWLFLYRMVIPLNDALLLTTAVAILTSLRLYFRNPFRSDH